MYGSKRKRRLHSVAVLLGPLSFGLTILLLEWFFGFKAAAAMLDPLPEGSRPDGIIIPRSFHVAVGNYGPATFVVRILFRRNAT